MKQYMIGEEGSVYLVGAVPAFLMYQNIDEKKVSEDESA